MRPLHCVIALVFLLSIAPSQAALKGGSVEIANALLSSLSPDLEKQALLAFDSERRTGWHYIPKEREGAAIGDLPARAKEALWILIGQTLSEKGIEAAKGAITLEQALHDIENSERRNPDNYYIVFWGKPSKEDSWGWRFEGHHLSINATFKGERLTSVTPTFWGANPAKVADGKWAGFRNLPSQEDLAREFILSLGKEQKEEALQPEDPGDVVGAEMASIEPPLGKGLKAAQLGEDQRAMLGDLLEVYVGEFNSEVGPSVGLDLEAIENDADLEVQWWGSMSAGRPHAYRICGKTLDIQFATRDADANHVHTVVRIPGRDFAPGN